MKYIIKPLTFIDCSGSKQKAWVRIRDLLDVTYIIDYSIRQGSYYCNVTVNKGPNFFTCGEDNDCVTYYRFEDEKAAKEFAEAIYLKSMSLFLERLTKDFEAYVLEDKS